MGVKSFTKPKTIYKKGFIPTLHLIFPLYPDHQSSQALPITSDLSNYLEITFTGQTPNTFHPT
jgi:hypothetical protein